jgi:hypothetical protein
MPSTPYSLPDNFNPDTNMLMKTTEYGVFHETRQAARLAERLAGNGALEDLVLAEKVLAAVLACQEVNPDDPHYGNFYWMREDSVVEDLNAVEFVLEALIPLMLAYGDRLVPAMQERVYAAIRLGLAEIARLDVLVAYTNITALDILNTCLGGELLGEPIIAERGYAKLIRWIEYTNQSGHPLEYNSPTYSAVTLRALKRLADLVRHDDTRLRAQTLAARLALSYALHLHASTGRLAGPHGRAYHPTIVGETPPEVETLRGWIADGTAPPWIADLLDARPASYTICETAEHNRGLAITTYLCNVFALGVASQNFHGQSNHCMVHFRRPDSVRAGVFYTRYLLDDKWFGDHYHATDRTKTRNLLDEGDFVGVQAENRAIGVYTAASLRQCHSAKAALIWTERSQVDELWVGDKQVELLPCPVSAGQVLVAGSGDVYIAIRPLQLTPLGRTTPMQLIERDGDLVLEMYNYQGEHKRFWELNWPGAFYQGRPVCGFYLEVAERTAPRGGGPLGATSGLDFGRLVASGEFTDMLEAPFTYPAAGERLYTAAYRRNGQELGLRLDVMQWRLMRRWTDAGDPGWPMLMSPMAAQYLHGVVSAGDAYVEASHGPVWLAACPQAGRWVAGYTGQTPARLKLVTPQGEATVEAMGTGMVIWDNGAVRVAAIGAKAEPTIIRL